MITYLLVLVQLLQWTYAADPTVEISDDNSMVTFRNVIVTPIGAPYPRKYEKKDGALHDADVYAARLGKPIPPMTIDGKDPIVFPINTKDFGPVMFRRGGVQVQYKEYGVGAVQYGYDEDGQRDSRKGEKEFKDTATGTKSVKKYNPKQGAWRLDDQTEQMIGGRMYIGHDKFGQWSLSPKDVVNILTTGDPHHGFRLRFFDEDARTDGIARGAWTKGVYEIKPNYAGTKGSKAKAMYVDDGDYYGYANGVYDEDDMDSVSHIGSPRLMQYAYKMGFRAGLKQSSKAKKRKHYF